MLIEIGKIGSFQVLNLDKAPTGFSFWSSGNRRWYIEIQKIISPERIQNG